MPASVVFVKEVSGSLRPDGTQRLMDGADVFQRGRRGQLAARHKQGTMSCGCGGAALDGCLCMRSIAVKHIRNGVDVAVKNATITDGCQRSGKVRCMVNVNDVRAALHTFRQNRRGIAAHMQPSADAVRLHLVEQHAVQRQEELAVSRRRQQRRNGVRNINIARSDPCQLPNTVKQRFGNDVKQRMDQLRLVVEGVGEVLGAHPSSGPPRRADCPQRSPVRRWRSWDRSPARPSAHRP